MSASIAPSYGFLSRERIVARPAFNRWLVPPAALAIHLCIGMAYGFSVFWLPLSRALGVTQPVTCQRISFVTELFSTTCDWRISSLGWMFTLFFVMLGSSAALWGGWLERVVWRPEGWTPPNLFATAMITTRQVHFKNAHKTPQFWLLWTVLCLNVSAGIGIIGMASPMLQEIFGGSLIGQAGASFTELDTAQR